MQKIKYALQLSLIFFITAFCGSVFAGEISAFGPKQYIRTTGAPNIYTDTFAAQPGTAQLVIKNGLPGEKTKKDKRIRSGVVSLNGEVLFTHDDFKHQTHILETTISLLESNDLHIELESIPTHYISIEIIQDIPDPVYDIHAADLVVDTANCPVSIELKAIIANIGEDEIPAGLPVSFYKGMPGEGGVLIGTTATPTPILVEQSAEITYTWSVPGVDQAVIYAVADDDGSGVGIYEESDETNNSASFETFLCPVIPSGESSIAGKVINAVTGDFLSATQVLLHQNNNGSPGPVAASAETDLDGKFLFEGLAQGSYIIAASPAGFIAEQKTVTLAANTDLTNQDLALSPILGDDEIRIILTWNDKPADLEAHLTSPNPDGCRFHCYYWNKNIPDANLDLDDQDGYGPETTTITNKGPGIYRYYVHDFTYRNYTNSRWLSLSGAQVKVYSGNNPPIVFNVTPYRYGNVWHVFNIDGDTGEVIPVDTMTNQSEPGRIDYPTITSRASRNAYWNSPYTYQVQVSDPDLDTHTYELLRAPEGMTIDPATGLVEWTPAGTQMGWYSAEVRVDDDRCGEATQVFSIYVYSQPTIQFSVDPCSGINPGGNITLNWSTTRATTILIDQGIGEVPASGSLTIPSPEQPTVYTITAFNDAALSKRSTPGYPYASFSFSPYWIDPGQSTTLRWTPYCSASATIDHNVGSVSPTESGTLVVTPTDPVTTYYMTVANATGSRRYAATVRLRQPPPPPPPNASISISPTCNMTPGEPMTLSWWSTNSNTVTITPDIGEVTPNVSGTTTVYPTEPGTYSITASGDGGTITRSVTFPNYPSVNFYSSAYGIDLGDSVTLRWSSSCADTVVMDQGIGELPASGSMVITPASLPITYRVTTTNERGSRYRTVRLYQIAPNGSISVNPNQIKVGATTTLTWSSTRADTCSITPDLGVVPCNGTTTVTPLKATTYQFKMVGPGGTKYRSAWVGFVPPMADLKASSLSITEGESVNLSWIYANADSSSIDQGIGDIELGGERTVAPSTTTTYRLTAVGPGGTASDTVTINVAPSTTPPPTVSLLASQTVILRGGSTDLTWQSDGATTLNIEPDVGAVDASGTATVSPEKTTTYTITATGPSGTSVARVTITVVQPAPNLTFEADRISIKEGESAVLSWTSEFADRVIIDPGIGDVDFQGSLTVTPLMTTTYKASAVGLGGITTKFVTVTVVFDPPTATLSAMPDIIDLGASTTLVWSTTNADNVTITSAIGPVDASGSQSVSPTETTTYTVTASGPGGTATAQATVTVNLPPPVVSLTANPTSIVVGESTKLIWSTEYAQSCTITPDVGTVPCTGESTISPAQNTVYTLNAEGSGGSASTQVAITVNQPNPITLTVTAPIDGDTVYRPDVQVTGSVTHSQGLETGVVVNGVIALVYDGKFVANHVPLQGGSNTIIVRATDANGEFKEETFYLTSDSTVPYVTLDADTQSGLAPLETTLRLDSGFNLLAPPDIQYQGPGVVDFLASTEPHTWNIRMTTPGIYHFTIDLQDESGTYYSDKAAVLAMDRAILDALLQLKWSGMKEKLLLGFVDEALNYFMPDSQAVFQWQFDSMKSAGRLSQAVNDMGSMQLIKTVPRGAVCDLRTVRNGEEYSFQLLFTRDNYGVWRVENF